MNSSVKFWDRISKISKSKKLDDSSLKVLENTKKHLNVNDNLLDFACGSGVITSFLSKEVSNALGIDISKGMIELANNFFSKEGFSNLKFKQLNILELKKEELYDVITAFNILFYLEDKEKYFKKINSLLKEDALFISSTACMKDKRSFLNLLMMFLSKLGIIPKIRNLSINELKKSLINCGFTIIEEKEISSLPEYFIVAKKIKDV